MGILLNKRALIGLLSVIALSGGAFAFTRGRATESGAANELVTATVERRTIQDTVTVRGSIEHKEVSRLALGAGGRVTNVAKEAGDVVNAGDPILSLDGRPAIAVLGATPFFRPLKVGDEGDDVAQLETILKTSGFSPGAVDTKFTEETRNALLRWQKEFGYSRNLTTTEQRVNVSLSQSGSSYSVGPLGTATGTIESVRSAEGSTGGGSSSSSSSGTAGSAAAGRLGGFGSGSFIALDTPAVVIAASPISVAPGETSTVTVTASLPFEADTSVAVALTGNAISAVDYVPVATTVFFPAGTTTSSFNIITLLRDPPAGDRTVVATISNVFSGPYTVGATSAATITIKGSTDKPSVGVQVSPQRIAEGASSSFTILADKVSASALIINYSISGTAVPERNYSTLHGTATLAAGQYAVNVPLVSQNNDLVEDDPTITLTVTSGAGYSVGAPASGTVTIVSDDVPELSISGGGSVGAGGSLTFTITADQAPVQDTSVGYSLSGTASAGQDFKPLPGTVVLPKGAVSASFTLDTIVNDQPFQPSDMLVATWPLRLGTIDVKFGDLVGQSDPIIVLTEDTLTGQLQLSAADRAKIREGLGCIVSVAATAQDAPGQITELDGAATISQDGKESYGGEVTIGGKLEIVDGADLIVEVILREAKNAIVVPVASVLLDGSGNPQVRVTDDEGNLTRVSIETGISEGAFVEVTSGLKGGEQVIVQVKQATASK